MKKAIEWSTEKNNFLLKERNLSFESIVVAMETGHLVATYPHPTKLHQKIFEVELDGYIVVVPYIEDDNKIFLKTAFHNRKATQRYKKENSL